jgi:uncharacterized membrane protein YfcA|tara:strand:- start:136 stop:972 length:837 start_codon:yes stop_codon:yes gene_type:complete
MFTVLSPSELTTLIIILAIAATISGFIAGLLGVGGGIIMVPALYYAFTVMDFDIATRMHLSLGTSLAIIIPTSIMSAKTHMKFNAVDFKLIKSFGIFIVLGVMLGTVLASNLKTPPLMLFFSFFAFLVGLFFIFFREKVGANPRPISQTFKVVIGMGLGFFAVPLGIGGGSLGVPAMRLFGYPIKTAIGTSAAIGFLISIFGAMSMSFSGFFFDTVNTPLSLGYVNLPGFLVFVPVTMLMAPIGARLVHRTDKSLLSKIFGVFLLIIAVRSFYEYLYL